MTYEKGVAMIDRIAVKLSKKYKTENREESWFLKKLFCFSSQGREKVKLNTEICWSIPLLKERYITINVFLT